MTNKLNRRTFLRTSLLTMGGLGMLAMRPLDFSSAFLPFDEGPTGDVARVATTNVSVYSRPSDKSTILYQRNRDDLVNIYYEVVSPDGPGYNPLWYRVWRGYIHSAHLERVKVRLNPVETKLPEKGFQLAQVTVPYTQTVRYIGYAKEWQPLYRLYYGSNHWIAGVQSGPDGSPHYIVHDELNEVEYLAPAPHFRFVQPEEYAPLPSTVEPWEKRIEVSIARQEVRAFENGKEVFKASVATGLPDTRRVPGLIRTDTPRGEFHVYSKMPSKHMGDGNLTADIEAYELPGVPWTTFFAQNGVAFHGTYWHTNWGTPMSHGCVNMRTEEALWIYRWATPICEPNKVETNGYGTLVVVK